MSELGVALAMTATQQTREFARSGLADAPVRCEPADTRNHPVRRQVARALHRLADHLEPTPPLPHPATR